MSSRENSSLGRHCMTSSRDNEHSSEQHLVQNTPSIIGHQFLMLQHQTLGKDRRNEGHGHHPKQKEERNCSSLQLHCAQKQSTGSFKVISTKTKFQFNNILLSKWRQNTTYTISCFDYKQTRYHGCENDLSSET